MCKFNKIFSFFRQLRAKPGVPPEADGTAATADLDETPTCAGRKDVARCRAATVRPYKSAAKIKNVPPKRDTIAEAEGFCYSSSVFSVRYMVTVNTATSFSSGSVTSTR